jgi:membrane protease YdiL (CAAX protease family)
MELHVNLIPETPTPKPLSWATMVFMHLFPGVVVAFVYALLARPIVAAGFPKYVALGLTALIGLIPVQLGFILLMSKRETGKFSLRSQIPFLQKLPARDYLIYVPILVVWGGLAFAATGFTGTWMLEKLFSWLPSWYVIGADSTVYPKTILAVAAFSNLFVTGIAAPVVEEIYFRGYLLPRMTRLGKLAPVVNTALFALYHFWSPWQFVTRVVAMVPMTWAVQRKESIKIAFWVHCLINILGDAIPVIILLFR